MDRKTTSRILRRNLDLGIGPLYSLEEIEIYLHIEYDDFDSKEELTRMFENEEVADYLLTFLNKMQVKHILLFTYCWSPELAVCPTLCICDRLPDRPEEEQFEVFDHIIEIYHRSGQEIKCRMVKRAKNHYKRLLIKRREREMVRHLNGVENRERIWAAE